MHYFLGFILFMNQYLGIFIIFIFSSLISIGLYTIAYFVTFKDISFEKSSAYECGFDPFSTTYMTFDIRYYLISILFIIFDLEISFLFPWSVVFLYLGNFGFGVALSFLGILTLGYIYEWVNDALNWQLIFFFLLCRCFFIIMLEKIYIGRFLSKAFSKDISAIYINESELLVIGISPFKLLFNNSKNNFSVLSSIFLQYKYLVDLWCVDYLSSSITSCFELNYRFRSLIHLNSELIYSVHLQSNGQFNIESIVKICPSADWLEREIWDLYGIFFQNNKNLRRILTDYGFIGYPFRKNFPLSGYFEVRYDDEKFDLISEFVQFDQNFRSISRQTNPWN